MIRRLLAVALTCLALAGQAVPALPSTPEEQAVVRELTKIRRFPREYAKYLRALGLRFKGNLWRLADHVPIRTQEGPRAVLEAAEFLEQVPAIPGVLAYSEALRNVSTTLRQKTA